MLPFLRKSIEIESVVRKPRQAKEPRKTGKGQAKRGRRKPTDLMNDF
jgi:hypothetical protein